MSIKDMPHGELLYKLINPRSMQNRMQRAERRIDKVQKYTGKGGGGKGRNPETPSQPPSGGTTRPELDGSMLSLETAIAADGTAKPSLVVKLPAELPEAVRGFVRYKLRVTDALGSTREYLGPLYDPNVGAVSATTMKVPTMPTKEGEGYTIQAQAVSAISGPSLWSEPLPYDVVPDTEAPPEPLGVHMSAKLGTIMVGWNPVDADDYLCTEVFLTPTKVVPADYTWYVGSTSATVYVIPFDPSQDTGLHFIYLRNRDRSGNFSTWAVSTDVSAVMGSTYVQATALHLDATGGAMRFYDDLGEERGKIDVSRVVGSMSVFASYLGAGHDYNLLQLATANMSIVMQDAATDSSRAITYDTGTTVSPHLFKGGSVVAHYNSVLSTTATDGFLYVPTCAGAPTGVPHAFTGGIALVYDKTNNSLYMYNGAWKKVALA